MSGQQLYNTAASLANGNVGNFKASVNVSHNTSRYDSTSAVTEAVGQLAITSGLTGKSGSLYVIDVKVTKPINAQVGIVGEQGTAAGGGNQVHFFMPPSERPQVFEYVVGIGRALQ